MLSSDSNLLKLEQYSLATFFLVITFYCVLRCLAGLYFERFDAFFASSVFSVESSYTCNAISQC